MKAIFYGLMAGLLLLGSGAGLAQHSIHQLIEAGELKVAVSVSPEAAIVPGQEVRLIIELATNRWFSGGTKLDIPEMESMVVVQRDKFAVNSSRRENGESWAVQSWQLSLFPQQEGVYLTPPVKLGLKINHAQFGEVEGSFTVPTLEFAVAVPPVIKEIPAWVATPSLTVERSFDRPLDELRVGDAFGASIAVKAENLLAMMLPQSQVSDVQGLAEYPGLPALINRQQRGENSAERIEKIDYVIEQGGEYSLSEQVFYWWNTQTNSLEMTVLPAVHFTVEAGLLTSLIAWVQRVELSRLALIASFSISVLVFLAFILRLYFVNQSGAVKTTVSQRQLGRRIRKAISCGDAQAVCRWLYVWLDCYPDKGSIYTLNEMAAQLQSEMFSEQLQVVLCQAYGDSQVNGKIQLNLPTYHQGLWQRLKRKLKPRSVDFQLDPK